MENSKVELLEHFREYGYVVIPGFLTLEEVAQAKLATTEIVEEYCQDSPISIFKDQSRDAYFAESGDKIRGFYEEGTVDKEGNLTVDKPADGLNKVGHALHTYHPTFRSLTFSNKMKELVGRFTEMKDPTVIQSMVMFKHPRGVGGVGATYLYTTPTKGTLLGLWIALDEAGLDNGCLHFLPGSHKNGKVYQRFVRNPDKSSETFFIHIGEPVPSLEIEMLKPATCSPGDLVLIDGLVIHQSAANTSNKSRLAYTFHIIDGAAQYSEENWLQPTSRKTFEKLKDVIV